ncbi:MAG TPA: hypothetical protein VH762_08445 [Gemmatimonadaceae bacterium]|jgi:hypothetical protein
MLRIRAAVAAIIIASATRTAAQVPSLKLTALDGATKTVTVTELQALPQVEVADSSAEAGRLVFRGPTVRSVVSLIGAPEGRALRGPSMMIVVVAEASDGYKVAYALAELDEQFGARTAIVALTENGKPLAAQFGPLRIAMAGEAHRARWIRQLTTLRLVRVQ